MGSSYKLDLAGSPATSAQDVAAASAVAFDPSTSAIVPDTTGTLTCRFVRDSADVTVAVVAGLVYPFRLQSVPVGNAVGFTALFNGAPDA